MLKITSAQQGKRLDVILAKTFPDYSRAFLQKVVKSGGVTLEGKVPSTDYRVHAGETFTVADFEELSSAIVPTGHKPPRHPSGIGACPLAVRAGPINVVHGMMDSPLTAAGNDVNVLFEDDALLVLNKPAGLVVHPAPGYRGETLIDWLKDYLGPKVTKIFTDPERLGLVHRLDKDTSGVLLIAKSVIAQTQISRQFHDRIVKKMYAAFIEGVPKSMRGVISAPIGRSYKQRSRMTVTGQGRPSETAFEVKEKWKEVSQLALFPKTGRTHQIRVHLAAIGHPILGDYSYGASAAWRDAFGVERTMLHAERLDFIHPLTKKNISFEAPWPVDFQQLKKKLGPALAVLLLLAGLSARGQADPNSAGASPAAPKPAASSSSGKSGPSPARLSRSINALREEVHGLKGDLESLKSQLGNLQQQMDQVNAGLNALNLAQRLRDLEKALSEMNGKNAANTATGDETKAQAADLARKIKIQQETLDQLRDQLDRLNNQMIELKTQQESAPGSAPDAAGKKP